MFVPVPTMALEWHAADRDKGRALTTMRLPFAVSPADADSVTDELHSVIQPIINCTITRVGWRWIFRNDDTETAESGSTTQILLALFYRNGDRYDAIYLPAPNPDFWETTGPYAGVRLDMSNPTVVAAIEALSTALAEAVTPGGEPFPTEFVVGGKVV